MSASPTEGWHWLRPMRRLFGFARKRGLRRTVARLGEESRDALSRIFLGRSLYEAWFEERQRIERERPGDLPAGPLISVVMPVCDPEPRWLDAAIASVVDQRYPRWQLCIVDDASTRGAVGEILRSAADSDARIDVQWNATRQGISRTSNRALEAARGEFVALLDHDDELTPDALLQVARRAREAPFDLLYSDEDKIDRRGRLRDPTFKPDHCGELLRASMYFGHLTVYRRSFLEELGGFDPAFDGSQDYELALRAEARAERIVHVPEVLYHWRMAEGSAANPDEDAKPWAYAAGRRAIEAAIRRETDRARIVDGVGRGHVRILREPRPGARISILHCPCCLPVESGGRDMSPTADGTPAMSVEWISFASPSRSEAVPVGARWNEAAARATGELLVFVEGLQPVERGPGGPWWSEVAAQLQRQSVGVVGAKLSRRGELMHVGAVLGGSDVVRTRPPGLRHDEPGHLALAQTLREVSAVTGGFLGVRADVLVSLGGFDEEYRDALHDVDLCLRLRNRRERVLYDPYVEFEPSARHEDSRGGSSWAGRLPPVDDLARLSTRWKEALARSDPFSSARFHATGAVLHPAFRPRTGG